MKRFIFLLCLIYTISHANSISINTAYLNKFRRNPNQYSIPEKYTLSLDNQEYETVLTILQDRSCPLLAALAQTNNTSLAQRILSIIPEELLGHIVNLRDSQLRTALHHVQSPEFAQLLLQYGAIADVTDQYMISPLMVVLQSGDNIPALEIAQVLCNKGSAKLTASDEHGSTLWHYVITAQAISEKTLQKRLQWLQDHNVPDKRDNLGRPAIASIFRESRQQLLIKSKL